MTIFWTSLVPSPISQTFASRIIRSTGYSSVYPLLPSPARPRVVAFMHNSDAKSFAMAASLEKGRPFSMSHAAW
jgi:hypothetical protein